MKATSNTKFKTVDEYISALPTGTKSVLKAVRKTIKQAAPGAEELISYNIPALKWQGMLIWYAGWKEHISLYPITAGMEEAFKKELPEYKAAKGTLKFPLNKPIPFDLISRIIKFRVGENIENTKNKSKK